MSEAGAEGLVELVERLRRGDVGKLPDGWDMGHYEAAVHRLFASAADMIEAQQRGNQFSSGEWTKCLIKLRGTEAALEAQGRALAEARAENERLRGESSNLAACCEAMEADCIKWIDRAHSAERQRDEALGALRALLADCTYHLTKFRPGPLAAARTALAALENSKAGLADANSKSSSSQDQEIAGLREELRRKDEALKACQSFLCNQTPNNDSLLDTIDAALAREEA